MTTTTTTTIVINGRATAMTPTADNMPRDNQPVFVLTPDTPAGFCTAYHTVFGWFPCHGPTRRITVTAWAHIPPAPKPYRPPSPAPARASKRGRIRRYTNDTHTR